MVLSIVLTIVLSMCVFIVYYSILFEGLAADLARLESEVLGERGKGS